MFKQKKNKIDLINVELGSIKFSVDNLFNVKNISFKDEVVIPNLCFFDKLHNEVLERFAEEDILFDINLFNKLQGTKFELSMTSKKKSSFIVGSTEIVNGKTKIKFIVNILIKNNEILISTRTVSNKKVFYGVSAKLDMSNIFTFKTSDHIIEENEIIKIPFRSVKYLHDGDIPNVIKCKKTQVDIVSSYESYFLDEKELTISPAIYGKKKKIINSWRLRPNKIENSFNVIKLTLTDI